MLKGFRFLFYTFLLVGLLMGGATPVAAGHRLVRVGLFENRPMCYTEAGRPAGIFITVLEYVAEQEGWQLQYEQDSWPNLLSKLEGGEIDILPSMALSPERQQKYAFNSLDVFTNWGEIYVKQGSHIHSFFDLQDKRVATLDKSIFTTGPEGIVKLAEVYGFQAELLRVASYGDALELVRQGKADAAVVNRAVGAVLGTGKELQKSGIVFAPVRVRFGLSRSAGSTASLIDAIDRHFETLQDSPNSIYFKAINQIFAEKPQAQAIPVWLSTLFWVAVVTVFVLVAFVVALRYQVTVRTRELQGSEKRFRDLAENSLDWIWEFDENAIFTYASPRIKDLLGYTPEEVIGISAFDLIPSPEKERVAEEFNASRDKHEPFSLLLNVNQHKDGHLVTLESSGVPIFDAAGNFKGYRGIDRDISERIALEDKLRQAQKMEAIGTLAGGIAHDFNNILSAIFGYAELAKLEVEAGTSVGDDLDQILHGARRAKELVKQILTFSRRTPQEKRVVELALIVKEALKLLRPSIPTTIAINEDIVSQAHVYADLSQIHQVIMNLCTNAYHAMEERGGTLTLSLVNEEFDATRFVGGTPLAAGQYVVLKVCDSGPGIAADNLAKIFEPYFTTKATGRGTGLGLAVVHGVVQSHEGAIAVDSEVGRGTCFSVYLPIVGGASAASPEQGTGGERAGSRGEHILVVDDEPGVRQVVSLLLASVGYQVAQLDSAPAALRFLEKQEESCDLLLTDMTMPGMTGKQLVLEVKNRYPQLPIILCTGYSTQLSPEEAQELGVSAYLTKPLDRAELLKEVRQALDKQQGLAATS